MTDLIARPRPALTPGSSESGDARASAAGGGCSTGRARWWTGPRDAGSGRRPAPSECIAERLDDVVEGRASPYEVAAEVLDSLKQGARL